MATAAAAAAAAAATPSAAAATAENFCRARGTKTSGKVVLFALFYSHVGNSTKFFLFD